MIHEWEQKRVSQMSYDAKGWFHYSWNMTHTVWVIPYELWSSNVCEGYCMSHKVWLMVHKLRNQWSSWIGTRWGYRGARKTNDSNDPKVWWRISWRKKRNFIKLSMLFFQLLSKLKYTVHNSQKWGKVIFSNTLKVDHS